MHSNTAGTIDSPFSSISTGTNFGEDYMLKIL